MIERATWIAGFWRRFCAFIIDIAFLSFIGFLLGLFFETYFIAWGSWAKLLGLGIASIYFITADSYLCKGKTFGRYLLNLRLVQADNHSLSLSSATLRYGIALLSVIPLFIRGLLPQEVNLTLWKSIEAFMILGVGVSSLYLFVFNSDTRQTLHDLVARSYVINDDVSQSIPKNIWPLHYVIVVSLFVSAFIAPMLTPINLVGGNSVPQHWSTIEQQLLTLPKVMSLNISESELDLSEIVTQSSELNAKELVDGEIDETPSLIEHKNYIAVKVILSADVVDDEGFADEIVKNMLLVYPDVKRKQIYISLEYGYDIGIWSNVHRKRYQFPPSLL